jgi:SAM-dependent methyltransferase
MSAQPIGWDHPDTARWYARFQRRYARYRRANRELVAHAALRPGMRVLDVAAGDGGTAAAALPWLGRAGRVVCFEPAAAMRASGRRTVRDGRVRWTDAWPEASADAGERFDRVLCGAAMWQMLPLAGTFTRIFELVRPGGCLCFDVPALYLGEPDAPGGGRDPMLTELPSALVASVIAAGGATPGPALDREPDDAPPATFPEAADVEEALGAVGFRAVAWDFRIRLVQRAYRAWLRIPTTTDHLLVGKSAEERATLIDAAFASVDPSSWRWERWRGWTAWRPAV